MKRRLLTLNAARVIVGDVTLFEPGDGDPAPGKLPAGVVEATGALAATEELLGRTLARDGVSVGPLPPRGEG
jgi:hypothetical protein